MKQLLPAALVLFYAACGGSGGGSDLTVLPTSEKTTILASLYSRSMDGFALVPHDDGVALVWNRGSGDDRSVTEGQILDGDLNAVTDVVLLSSSDPQRRLQPALCSDHESLAAAWAEIVPNDLQPIGITLDVGDASATFSWNENGAVTPAERVNPNTIGRQINPAVACLANGMRAVSWSNVCTGSRKVSHNAFTSYDPPECPSEPANGTYLQIFDTTGSPVGDMKRTGEYFHDKTPVAALSSGNFLLLVESRIELRSSSGELLDEVHPPNAWFSDADLSCSAQTCAAILDGTLWIIDPARLASTYSVSVDETMYPKPNQEIFPTAPSVGCDQRELCLVTWVRFSETQMSDYYESESLGVFARAIDLRTGQLGDRVLLHNRSADEDGVRVAAVGAGRFVTAGVVDRNVLLQRIDVQ